MYYENFNGQLKITSSLLIRLNFHQGKCRFLCVYYHVHVQNAQWNPNNYGLKCPRYYVSHCVHIHVEIIFIMFPSKQRLSNWYRWYKILNHQHIRRKLSLYPSLYNFLYLRDLKLLWNEWATDITATFHLLSSLFAHHILQLKIIFVNYIAFISFFWILKLL